MSDDYKIIGTIKREDIPNRAKYRTSKYEAIYNSCGTLAREEGIEVEVGKSHVRSVLQKGLKKRYPRRFFEITGRKHPDGYKLYILRKSVLHQ